MTYHQDLSRNVSEPRGSALNVGWLDEHHAFPIRPPTERHLDLLWAHCSVLVLPTRGFHDCPFCAEQRRSLVRAGKRLRLGSAELRVFGNEGDVFAAPNLIFHYVAEHHYAPPPEFLRALEEGRDPAGECYRALLDARQLNWSENPTLTEEPTPLPLWEP
jgi:hypothetical protein